jgi:hypothetical protein
MLSFTLFFKESLKLGIALNADPSTVKAEEQQSTNALPQT